jgi:OPT family oligopeptide transporter
MAPDRGNGSIRATSPTAHSEDDMETETETLIVHERRRSEAIHFQAKHAEEGQNFTVRGVLVGLGVGLIITFSNTYFGLQTGWVSSMSMPSSLIGFAFFKTLARHLDLPFTPVENVLVQTVAGSMGTMPLGCGFVGVMPALNYLMKPEEGGPLFLSLWQLILWALGLCYFGVVFAVPLRRQVIIREKLKFPSGTATALMIGVLHGKKEVRLTRTNSYSRPSGLLRQESRSQNSLPNTYSDGLAPDSESLEQSQMTSNWRARVKLLIISFAVSGMYTLGTYFFPVLRNLPVFGIHMANTWLWTLNPSFAYVGQGIIMGPATTLHMLLGAIIGWGILSPFAKHRGWAPGDVSDWETGSKGWLVWISLAIMLADSVISLGYLICRSLVIYGRPYARDLLLMAGKKDWANLLDRWSKNTTYSRLNGDNGTPLTPTSSNDQDSLDHTEQRPSDEELDDLPEVDAPPEHLIGNRVVWFGLITSIVFCVFCIRVTFGALIPLYATITAVFMALILSIMGVRALGETDLNPVSGISKLAQLFFALIIPQSNKNSVLINLIAGAVSEAGALQAGDLLQDLKTGHLLGAAPKAQFWGQIIGSTVGAVVSALVYRLYTSVYEVPGELFQVPTGYVWIFTARLVTGQGLPPMAAQWALGAAILFTITTCIRIVGSGKKWHPFIPGGIAVAVGMLSLCLLTLFRL